MFSFRKMWHKMMGLERPLEHCVAHKKHQPKCNNCIGAEKVVAESWGPYWNAEGDTSHFQNTLPEDHEASAPHLSSDFHGFDGGSSGGGGASGDW